MKEIIKSGDKFNRLTAIKFIERKHGGYYYWLFRCDCGKEKIILANHVKRGATKSCGCLLTEVMIKRNNESSKHRMCNTGVYKSWVAMKVRCLNKNHQAYKNYGDRGITICDEWLKFENFYKDMGERPEGKTLDRINNDKGYYKDNCRWATSKEQQNNTSRNHCLTYKGKTQTMSQWADEYGINYSTFCGRMEKKWSVEKILTFKKL